MKSLWKGPFILPKVYTNLMQQPNRKVFFLKRKNSVILPEFVGLVVKVYNGQKFLTLVITPKMVGYKFGSFVFTRRLHVFKAK